MKISIVIPVYNASKTIADLTDGLFNVLKDYELEVVLVNDGSSDSTHEICLVICKKFKNQVKYLRLAKNFGQHNAALAGLNYAFGEYVITMDDDFQNPPEEIPKLLEKIISNRYDVVYSYYQEKKHSYFRNLGSKFNNLTASFLMDKPVDLYLSDFRCMNKFLVQEIIKYKGPYPYIDGLILRTTRNIGQLLVRHEERKEGKSGYTFIKLVRLWINMFINFSIFPLRISTYLGFFFSVTGGFISVFMVIDKIRHPETPLGFTSIIVSILVFSGIQLMMLGMIGEYMGKQFLINNQTPQYVLRESILPEEARAKL